MRAGLHLPLLMLALLPAWLVAEEAVAPLATEAPLPESVVELTSEAEPLPAEEADSRQPVISIIIDDLGDRARDSRRAVRLPGAVAVAILPHTSWAKSLAEEAHSLNKEVLLHLPMESINRRTLGPGGLTLDMTQRQFIDTLQRDLEAVPHVTGINNHMGSLLTRHPGHMLWLMQEMNRHGDLFFIDSRTTNKSVAAKLAVEHQVPLAQRDIFLDHERDEAVIREQYNRLLVAAERFGSAMAIGHPYPETMNVLEEMLPKLDEAGIRLVSVSELISRQGGRSQTWQAYLSR